MRKSIPLVVALAAAAALVTTTGGRLQAGLIGGPLGLHDAADEHRLAETVKFRWRGHRYCWSNRGWRGAGWYRCGWQWRSGGGWGGPGGWQGRRRSGRPAAGV